MYLLELDSITLNRMINENDLVIVCLYEDNNLLCQIMKGILIHCQHQIYNNNPNHHVIIGKCHANNEVSCSNKLKIYPIILIYYQKVLVEICRGLITTKGLLHKIQKYV